MNFLLASTIKFRKIFAQSKKVLYIDRVFSYYNKINPQWRNTYSTIKQIQANTTADSLVKDVIVFKYENPKFFKLLNFFAISQFFFWNYLAHFSFTTLRDTPIDKNDNTSWWQRINLGESRYRNGITICCFLVGYGILSLGWMYTLRSVRFLILRKGGQEVSFVTYTPFGNNRIISVPLRCISAEVSRESARNNLSLKVKNKSFFYILDMKGEFLNSKLYDFTIGLKRKF